MEEKLKQLELEAAEKVEAAGSLKEVNDIRVQYLGKKGPITEVLRGMGKLSAEERPKMGALANEVRERIAAAITAKNEQLEQEEMNKKLSSQTIDVTLPGSQVNIGGRHPLTVVIEEIEDLFIGMGYTVEEGTEVETDYYNIEGRKLPKENPARDMQDSF